MTGIKRFPAFVLVVASAISIASGATYHIDSGSGDDGNDGRTSATAWKTLSRVGDVQLEPGDHLLLRRGRVFEGQLALSVRGRKEKPILVGAYGPDAESRPVIDARGYLAGVHLQDCSHILVADLEITSDGGTDLEERAWLERYGVLAESGLEHLEDVTLRNLYIHHIFATEETTGLQTKGRRNSSNMGVGILVKSREDGRFSGIRIENCEIEQTGHTGIKINGGPGGEDKTTIRDVHIIGNRLKHIGGPGIQPSRVSDVVVRRNVVDHSGSSADPRMHNRGSGIWPWACDRVLIEHNRFMHARGVADSCGVHIDFNCRDVIVQYNLSIDNEGGFIEVLGNNYNCAYRYNISINDGSRAKGVDGAFQEGHTLWISGYIGKDRVREGPFHTYIYNNTIYTRPGSRSCIAIDASASGALIANNIFHILGDLEMGVLPGRNEDVFLSGPEDVILANNLYIHHHVLPVGLSFGDLDPRYGDAMFHNPGGFEPGDYVPANIELIRDTGIPITALPGDEIGLRMGFHVDRDFLGNPVKNLPDMGAIELP